MGGANEDHDGRPRRVVVTFGACVLTWSGRLPDGSLWYRLAEPDDPDVDLFSAGTTPEAIEVTEYFTSRQWYDYGKGVAKPPVNQFGTADEVVGYIALAFANKPHPSEGSLVKARYLVVYVVGIHERFQGQVNPVQRTPAKLIRHEG